MPTEQRRLVLIRHAQTREGDTGEDHDRPLTERGSSDAAALGHWLKDNDVQPHETRCSTAARARETWAAAVEASGIGAIVEHDQRIYQADPDTLLRLLREVDPKARTVVMVGHAPGIPRLAAALDDGEGDADARGALADGFPTCTVAVLDLAGDWGDIAPGAARLHALHTARS